MTVRVNAVAATSIAIYPHPQGGFVVEKIDMHRRQQSEPQDWRAACMTAGDAFFQAANQCSELARTIAPRVALPAPPAKYQ